MKRVLVLWIVSIGLCSGCAPQQAILPAPVILNLPDCPAPAPPALPPIRADAPLDSPENADLLMQRDDRTRQYIDGLRAAITCYRRGKNHESR